MTALLIFILFALGSIIALFVGYTLTTNSIIKDQERQLARVVSENNRLRERLKKANTTEVINIYTDKAKEPVKFGGF